MREPDASYAILEVGSATFDSLESLSGHEAIGEPFRYEGRASIQLPLPTPSSLLGAPATLKLIDRFGQRTLSGVVSEVETRTTDFGKGEVLFVFVPKTHTLTLGRASRSFQDESAIDVVETVVSPACSVVRSLTRDYAKVPYRVEREEDDWSFAVRTLEAEGVTFYYDHDDGSALVLTDDTRSAPRLSGLSVFPYHPDGLDVESEAVVSLARTSAATTHTVTRKSFSWKKPSLALAHAAGSGRYESYDAPGGGAAEPDALERDVHDSKGAHGAESSGIAGEAATLRLYPGRTFSISAVRFDEPWLEEEWLITSMDIELAGRKHAFATRFEGIAKNVPYRAHAPIATTARRGMSAVWAGSQPGISWGAVVASPGDEVYPDDHARTRVQMHWDRGGARDASSGTWMRVAQRFTTGSMMFPRTSWYVATVNEEGSVDAPHILSRIHDGERPPEYALPGNKTRVVFKTATSPGGGSHNEIHFEDAKGRENVFWNASKDMNVLTKFDAGERVLNDAWHDVGVNQTIWSGASRSEQVTLDQTVTIAANQTTTIGEHRAKTVGGNETVTVGGSRNLNVAEGHALGVKGNRSLTVGAALIDVSLGQIGTTARIVNTKVGGAIVRLTAKNFTEDASIASAELVGAVKVETAGVNRTTGVAKRFVEAVGGAIRVDAGKRYIDSATKTSKWSVGGLMKGSTKEVTFEGYKSIELRCGESSIVLEPEQIRVEAKTLLLTGAELEALTKIIVHNG